MKALFVIYAFLILPFFAQQIGENLEQPTPQIHIHTKKIKNKRILIAFFSHSGTTARTAQKLSALISENPDVDVETEMIQTPEIKNTLWGNVKLALFSLWESDVQIIPMKKNPEDYDTVVVCFPIWMGAMALPVQTYIKTYLSKAKKSLKIFGICNYGISSLAVIKSSIQKVEEKNDRHFISYITIKSDTYRTYPEMINQMLAKFAQSIIKLT